MLVTVSVLHSHYFLGSADDPPMVWDIKTGRKLKQLECSLRGSSNVAVAMQGSRILNMDRASKSAIQWEWPSGKTVKFPPNIKDIFKMCISQNNNVVVFVSEHTPGTLVLVFDLVAHKETLRLVLHEKLKDTTQLFMTKNGRYLTFLRELSEEEEDGVERKIIGVLTIDTTKNAEQEPTWVERDIRNIVPIDDELFLLAEKSGVFVWQPPKIAGIIDPSKHHNGWLQSTSQGNGEKKDTDVTINQIAVSMDDKYIAVADDDDGTFILWQNILKQDAGSQKRCGQHLKKHTNVVSYGF